MNQEPKSPAAESAPARIQVRETVVFDGNRGWEHGGVTYRLACGASIAEMPHGDTSLINMPHMRQIQIIRRYR